MILTWFGDGDTIIGITELSVLKKKWSTDLSNTKIIANGNLYVFGRGLSIGRIDQLGRFETDIEPEPDKKSGILNIFRLTF